MESTILWQRECAGYLDTEFVDGIIRVSAYEEGEPTPPGTRVTDGLQVLYTFKEGEGKIIHDVSGSGEPLNMMVESEAAVTWLQGGGLVVNSANIIASVDAATKVIAASKAANEITIEAWIKPANTTQDGPARIFALSTDFNHRNFQLGQAGEHYDIQLRTTETTDNGDPAMLTPAGSLIPELTHVAYTRDASGVARIYIGGELLTEGMVGGDFSNWDEGYRLALANELVGNRPWVGEYQLAAIYSRALSASEISQNFEAGGGEVPEPPAPEPPPEPPPTPGELAAPVLVPIGNPNGADAFVLDWNDVTGATSYTLEQDDNAGFSAPAVRYSGASSQYSVTGQAAGTWYYRVRASNAEGDSAWSNTESVVVAEPVPPPPPTGEIISYGGSHISSASSHYKVWVNGKPVFVHFFEGHNPDNGRTDGVIHYAHFAFDGTADIEVEYKDAINASQTRISPRRWGITPTINGKKLNFSISDPRKLVIAINLPLARSAMEKKHHLVIFAEAHEVDPPRLGDPNVVKVTSAGNAQSAINSCPDGGVVYFPSGTYNLSTQLTVTKGNITLYLEGGAFLNYSSGEPIKIKDKDNLTIRGRGVLQSYGRILVPKRVNNWQLEGLIVRNRKGGAKAEWAFSPERAFNSSIRNVKVITAPPLDKSRDGLNPNSCQDLVIDDCFIYSGDDSFALKAFEHTYYGEGPPADLKNITIKNCVVFTLASGIKTGSEIYKKIDGLTWENNDVVFGVLTFCTRSTGSEAVIKNLHLKGVHWENGTGSFFEVGWKHFDLRMQGTADFVIDDMVVYTVWPGQTRLIVYGASNANITVTFNNLRVKGKLIRSRQDLVDQGVNVSIENARVTFNA